MWIERLCRVWDQSNRFAFRLDQKQYQLEYPYLKLAEGWEFSLWAQHNRFSGDWYRQRIWHHQEYLQVKTKKPSSCLHRGHSIRILRQTFRFWLRYQIFDSELDHRLCQNVIVPFLFLTKVKMCVWVLWYASVTSICQLALLKSRNLMDWCQHK